jgi:hypothetical protein
MSKAKGVAAAIIIALLLCATVGWSDDQDQVKDQIQLQDQTQDQLKDGSCEDVTVAGLATPKGNGDCDRLQDCPCDGIPDQDRDQDRARDGSCLA